MAHNKSSVNDILDGNKNNPSPEQTNCSYYTWICSNFEKQDMFQKWDYPLWVVFHLPPRTFPRLTHIHASPSGVLPATLLYKSQTSGGHVIHSFMHAFYDQHLLGMLHISGINIAWVQGDGCADRVPTLMEVTFQQGTEAGSGDSIPALKTKNPKVAFPWSSHSSSSTVIQVSPRRLPSTQWDLKIRVKIMR